MPTATGRVVPVLGLAAHVGRGIQRVATDAVIGRMRSLPRTVDDLTAESLSRIMRRQVTSMSVIAGDAGTSSRARLSLHGNDVPASVFVKLPAQAVATRLIGELGRLAQTEVLFYRELSPKLTGVPATYGSAFDALTGRFVLVLEDLAADSCDFPDTLHPLDRDQANKLVELLARLHATFWERLPPAGSGAPLGWIYSASGDHTSLLTGSLLNTSARRLADRTSILVEDGRYIIDNYRAVAQLIDKPTEHSHARRRASGQRLLPQRRSGIARLAGGSPRSPRTRIGVHADHQHDHCRPPGLRT